MTEIQQKVISQCLKELAKVDSFRVWQDVNTESINQKIPDGASTCILKAMRSSIEEHVTTHADSVKGWLSALLEDEEETN